MNESFSKESRYLGMYEPPETKQILFFEVNNTSERLERERMGPVMIT